MKTLIADFTAKHRVMMMLSHMAAYRVPGGFRNFLKRYDELLKWVREKKIPVHTVSGWSRKLYGEKERAPQFNIMPSLTRFSFISSFFRSSASIYIERNL